ncbi:MAG TPA: hypothetical protein VNR39_12165 [Pseudolabrys sp.]|nr:hypothetical protein [Pseudolabrys sp.]
MAAPYKPRHVTSGTRTFFLEHLERAAATKSPAARNVERAVGELLIQHAGLAEKVGKVETLAGYGFLNDAGRTDARRKALGDVYKLRIEVQRALEKNAHALNANAPKLKSRDGHDAAAELRDREIRDLVRSWPEDKRSRLDSYSPELVDAIVYAPAELSGLMPAVHEELRKNIIEKQSPGKYAAHAAGVEALTWADEALRMIDKDLTEAGEFKPHEYDAHVREMAARPDVKTFPDLVDVATGLPAANVIG